MYSKRIEDENFKERVTDDLYVKILNINSMEYSVVTNAIYSMTDEQKNNTITIIEHVMEDLKTLNDAIKGKLKK
jgi:hypothetical protein